MPDAITITRTIDCTYTTMRFREGLVDVSGYDIMSAQIDPLGATALASVTAVVDLQSGSDPRHRQALSVAQSLTGSTPFVRELDISADRFVDGVVSTAQSGVVLKVTLHLRKRTA